MTDIQTFRSNEWSSLLIEEHSDELGDVRFYLVVEEWAATGYKSGVIHRAAESFTVEYEFFDKPEQAVKVARGNAEAYLEARAKAKSEGHPRAKVVSAVSVDSEESEHVHDAHYDRHAGHWSCKECYAKLIEQGGRYTRPDYYS